ncbi:MAG: hypothetical protein ACTSU2_15960 [Promethearchaeota archaeon]
MGIQSFFVMRASGEKLFVDRYEKDFNIDLICGFVSAMFAFIEHSLKTTEIENIDADIFRFLFSTAKINNINYIFVLLIERKDNIAEYQPRLIEAKNRFIYLYSEQLKTWNGDSSVFKLFREHERAIFKRKTINMNEEMEKALLIKIQNLYDLTEFALGAAILTQTGTVLLSFIENTSLVKIVKLLEGRFHAGAKKLNQIVSVEEEGIFVMIGRKNIIVASIYQKECPMGSALVFGQRLSDEIEKIIYNK